MMKNTTEDNIWNVGLFHWDGEFLTYGQYRYHADSKFVARFKYNKRDRVGFQKFLVNNFTPAEYFGRRAADETPVAILKSKGYISTTIRSMLKRGGYSINQAGVEAMQNADRASWQAGLSKTIVSV